MKLGITRDSYDYPREIIEFPRKFQLHSVNGLSFQVAPK